MLFGQSLFQSVLTRLAEEGAEITQDEADAGSFRVAGLKTGFVGQPMPDEDAAAGMAEPDATRPPDPYAAMDEAIGESATPWPPQSAVKQSLTPPDTAEPQPEAAPAPPAYLDRLTLGEIAEDLGLQPGDSAAMIAARRRAFARLNHPDRVADIARDKATRRMTIANALVDAALDALDQPGSPHRPARRHTR